MKFKSLLFLWLCFSLLFSAKAQTHAVFVQFSDKSAALYPFYRVFEPTFYPAFTVGVDIEYWSKGRSSLHQSVGVGAYFASLLGQGIHLTTLAGYKYTYERVYGEVFLGAGYLQALQTREVMEQDDAGVYHKVRYWGRPELLTPMGMSIGMSGSKFSPYIRYAYMLQLPYNSFIPFLPSSELSVGLFIKIHSHE